MRTAPQPPATPTPGPPSLVSKRRKQLSSAALMATLVGILVPAARYAAQLRHIATRHQIDVPIGPDADMWGTAALSVAVGAGSPLPPLYPHVLAWTAGRFNLVSGYLNLNMVLLALLPPLAGWAAAASIRHPVLRVGAALAAGIGTLVHARVATHVWFLRPELLTTAVLLLVAGTGLRFARSRTPRDAVLMGLVCGLALTVREHGVVVAIGGLASVPLLTSGSLRRRALATLGAALMVQLVTAILVKGGSSTPFFMQAALTEKIVKPLLDSMGLAVGAQGAAHDLAEMPHDAMVNAEGAGLFQVMLDQARTVSAPVMPLLAAGGVGLGLLVLSRRWREGLVLGAALAPLAATLMVWTEYRHFIVLVPSAILAAVVGGAALVEKRAPRIGAAVLVVGIVATIPWGSAWLDYEIRDMSKGLSMRTRNQRDTSAVAAKLRTLAGPDDRVMGDHASTIAIATGVLPYAVETRAMSDLPRIPDVQWRAWAVLDRSPGDGWALVEDLGNLGIYRRVRPAGVPEQCLLGTWFGPPMLDAVTNFVSNGVAPVPGCTDGRELGFPVAPTRPTTVGRQLPPAPPPH